MSNKNVLVGFSPRMTTYDIITGDHKHSRHFLLGFFTLLLASLLHSFSDPLGQRRYLRWQNTWWSGTYSIILTKACLLHRNYLDVRIEDSNANSLLTLLRSIYSVTSLTLQFNLQLIKWGIHLQSFLPHAFYVTPLPSLSPPPPPIILLDVNIRNIF